MRTYPPEPFPGSVWGPPVPVVVLEMSVQALPSGEVWISKALPYAVSHCNWTDVMVAVPPRSTRSHCGSLQVLPQRVVELPSTAAAAGELLVFSTDEAS